MSDALSAVERDVAVQDDGVPEVTPEAASPGLMDALTEGVRASAEVAHLTSLWPTLSASKKGDGHTVLVLPGFLGSDLSTTLCRSYLRRHGYDALSWGQGRNTGRVDLQARLVDYFLRLSDDRGAPISLVGHSLGGVFSREIARRYPDRVRSVVSLGSPFGVSKRAAVLPVVRKAFESVSNQSIKRVRETLLSDAARLPPGVPSTAIYSRSDGVVHWRSCMELPSTLTENIEVYGSHCGLIANASVLLAVSDRLAQDPQQWQRFTPRRRFGVRYPHK